jgi:hypothetical protein
VFVVGVAAAGCDGGTPNNAPPDMAVLPPDLVTPPDLTGAQLEPFYAKVVEFGSKPPKYIADADVALIDDLGNPTGVSGKTGADGSITIMIPTGKPAGFKVSKVKNKDTYQFGLRPMPPEGETLWIVTESLYDLAPALAGVTVDKTKGIVAGSVYWVNSSNVEEHVGCAKVSTDKGGDVRYFDPNTGLPTTLQMAMTTSKKLGYFLVANMDVGEVNVSAKLNDSGSTPVGMVKVLSVANAICIQNIYATGAANPTPGNCSQ